MYKRIYLKISYLKKTIYLDNFIQLLLGVFILFASAQIIIPIKPVPITLQTLMISLIGFTYKPLQALITVITYIAAGIIGFPMFAKFGYGLTHLTGMSGGYLIGFTLAAPLIAWLYKYTSDRRWSILICCIIGHIIIYSLGVIWLSAFIGLKDALQNGLLVYIPTGILKIIIFTYLFSYIKNNIYKKY